MKKLWKNKIIWSLLVVLMGSTVAFAQSTIIRGVITDSISGYPVTSASVYFKGGKGVAADSLGRFEIKTNANNTKLIIAAMGYKQLVLNITRGKEQNVEVMLVTDNLQYSSVTVTTNKRAKYTNRDNPAVELIRKVIEHKDENRPSAYDYLEYEQYEKIQAAISGSTEKIANSRLMRKYNFFFENRDTSKLDGKSLLPIYLEESLTKKYFRKAPESNKSILLAEKKVNFGDFVDKEGLSDFMNRLYQHIDIYDNSVPVFTFQFVSPIAASAPTYYLFYIRDTVVDEHGIKLVKMYFTPRNTNDLLFRGNMYITLDGNYSIQKINMVISKNANINWVRELNINLSFERGTDNRYHLSKEVTMADMGLSKSKKTKGLYGERSVSFKNYTINQPAHDTMYSGSAVVKLDSATLLPEDFWLKRRHDRLSNSEAKIYTNIDSVQKMPSFRRTIALLTLLFAGYAKVGPFDIGPANTFYSFNPIEGFRLRFGGRTTSDFNKRLYFETYGAYGFKDEKFKYYLSSTYSLNNKSVYTYPLNYIKLSVQSDTKIPGQDLEFIQEDNFLLSFKRGNNERWLYNKNYRFEYVKEYNKDLSLTLGINNWKQQPAGILEYIKPNNGFPVKINDLTTTEFSAQVRWSPHQEYYQTKVYRIPVQNKYPILKLGLTAGVKGVLGGEYNYQKIDFSFDKRFYMSRLGFADATFDAGYIFGQLPFPLLTVHRANQTYAYQLNSYNLMNFLEFVSDQYVSFAWVHHFNGMIFNKIPLLKKMKLREVASFKILYGGMRNENNPDLNPSLYEFPKLNNVQTSFALSKGVPYTEGSVGVENLFKILRVDFVRRFNYTENPDVAPWGIRARFRFDF